MNISELGPLWVGDMVGKVRATRDTAASGLALLTQPAGDYAKPHEMLIGAANAMLAAPDLLAALVAYQAAQAMPIYGDSSDFVGGKITMREPGNSAWGWICDKHGLGYQSGCICCSDDFKRHGERKDREARYARDNALRAAAKLSCAAIAKATAP